MSTDEFNVTNFEKKLSALKDTQESINSLSAWCLQNRKHHKKIVQAWLNVLKRVKVEHRLTLFYLANDVIQYSKRKNYEFVESWGTTLQRATTLVREEKVKHRILRIFKIWEQRSIYSEEFLADLSGLISITPHKKTDESVDIQPSVVIAKINACSKLEEVTDLKLRRLNENAKSLLCNTADMDAILTSLKDRKHVEDVDKKVEDSIQHLEGVTNALIDEITARKQLLILLTQADEFYRTLKGEVKVVANAYRNFGGRVRNLKKRIDEMLEDESRWSSPVPSPDINAPSPSPDSDLDLPTDEFKPNFYTPAEPATPANGLSSFMGLPFDLLSTEFRAETAASLANNLIELVGNAKTSSQFERNAALEPPPMPPAPPTESFGNYSMYNFDNSMPYQVGMDEYNPEEELEIWDTDVVWPELTELETPESPPSYEKEGVLEPIEVHESVDRTKKKDEEKKDVDHRNLISLTGSPGKSWSNYDTDYRKDQDYRAVNSVPPPPLPPILQANNKELMQQLVTQPPPLPPNSNVFYQKGSAKSINNTANNQDFDMRAGPDRGAFFGGPMPNINVPPPVLIDKSRRDNKEMVDMDLSDDEAKNDHVDQIYRNVMDIQPRRHDDTPTHFPPANQSSDTNRAFNNNEPPPFWQQSPKPAWPVRKRLMNASVPPPPPPPPPESAVVDNTDIYEDLSFDESTFRRDNRWSSPRGAFNRGFMRARGFRARGSPRGGVRGFRARGRWT